MWLRRTPKSARPWCRPRTRSPLRAPGSSRAADGRSHDRAPARISRRADGRRRRRHRRRAAPPRHTGASMTREEIETMRWDERPDLEDDLIPIPEGKRARIAAAPHAVDVEAHGAAKAEQAARRELSPPHAEQLAELRGTFEVNDSRRVDGPEPRAAARRANADARRDDDHAPVRKELEMDAQTRSAERTRARPMHRRRGVVLRSHTDRRRHERKHRLYGIALVAVVGLLAGCGGGGSSGSPTITIQPAAQYRLVFKTLGPAVAGKATH